jgi:hypothetical protein
MWPALVAYTRFKLLHALATRLPQAVAAENFAFFSKFFILFIIYYLFIYDCYICFLSERVCCNFSLKF